jgi:cell division protease FtsH
MRFGMSEKLGPRVLGRNHDMPFLGREMGAEPDYSEEVAREIDDEIRRIIEEAHEHATVVLKEHIDELHKISLILIERETIDKEQFERLLTGESEQAVFDDETAKQPSEAPADDKKRKPEPKTRPFPIPGATMQPPPPEPSKG